MNRKDIRKNNTPYVFLLVFVIGCLIAFNLFNNTIHELSYDDFIKNLNGGKITELVVTPKVRTETYKLEGKLDDYNDNETFILYLPFSDEFISKITNAKENTSNFELVIKNDPEASSWLAVLVDVVPILKRTERFGRLIQTHVRHVRLACFYQLREHGRGVVGITIAYIQHFQLRLFQQRVYIGHLSMRLQTSREENQEKRNKVYISKFHKAFLPNNATKVKKI